MARNEYIERLQTRILELHGCDSQHIETVPVHEVLQGHTVWKADVEIFEIFGHPKAKRCYAWSGAEGETAANPEDAGCLIF